MLSYDKPVSVNTTPSSAANMVATLNTMSTTTKPINATVVPVASSTIAQTNGQSTPSHHHIWLVTGPAGCGKSTVAKHLSESLNLPYIEGDEVWLILCGLWRPLQFS